MSAAREIAARVAACRAQAEALLAEVNALAERLPEYGPDYQKGSREEVLSGVRAELEVAAQCIEPAIDYLTPRPEDDDPGCCAHRRLERFVATEEVRT